jgi:hypothetical protein
MDKNHTVSPAAAGDGISFLAPDLSVGDGCVSRSAGA